VLAQSPIRVPIPTTTTTTTRMMTVMTVMTKTMLKTSTTTMLTRTPIPTSTLMSNPSPRGVCALGRPGRDRPNARACASRGQKGPGLPRRADHARCDGVGGDCGAAGGGA
jgi:hypothetical protein